jgi:redox-sensitive bicupin YhaK (pirin superfamily)
MVGAWCFVDHYGPDEIAREPGMQVPPHPHTGLQTVSWLLDGEVHHRDSLGSDVLIRPGELGLMTAGGGIAHSEQSPDPHSPMLHGAQLWVALPGAERERAPSLVTTSCSAGAGPATAICSASSAGSATSAARWAVTVRRMDASSPCRRVCAGRTVVE